MYHPQLCSRTQQLACHFFFSFLYWDLELRCFCSYFHAPMFLTSRSTAGGLQHAILDDSHNTLIQQPLMLDYSQILLNAYRWNASSPLSPISRGVRARWWIIPMRVYTILQLQGNGWNRNDLECTIMNRTWMVWIQFWSSDIKIWIFMSGVEWGKTFNPALLSLSISTT